MNPQYRREVKDKLVGYYWPTARQALANRMNQNQGWEVPLAREMTQVALVQPRHVCLCAIQFVAPSLIALFLSLRLTVCLHLVSRESVP